MRRKWRLIRTRVLWNGMCILCSNITYLKLNKSLTLHQEILKHCFSLNSMGEKLFSHDSKEWTQKLHKRILTSYAGIARNKLQTFLNENLENARKKTVFRNKPPLQPVVSHIPNSRHQIDLVCLEKDPQVRDGKVYVCTLGTWCLFTLSLRPTTSKEHKEIKEILTDISLFSFYVCTYFVGKKCSSEKDFVIWPKFRRLSENMLNSTFLGKCFWQNYSSVFFLTPNTSQKMFLNCSNYEHVCT